MTKPEVCLLFVGNTAVPKLCPWCAEITFGIDGGVYWRWPWFHCFVAHTRPAWPYHSIARDWVVICGDCEVYHQRVSSCCAMIASPTPPHSTHGANTIHRQTDICRSSRRIRSWTVSRIWFSLVYGKCPCQARRPMAMLTNTKS